LSGLAAKGVDAIDASDTTLLLTVAQYQALGTVHLTGADAVTLSDTGAHIAALSAGQIGALAAAGIDILDASNNALSLSASQHASLGTVDIANTDIVTVTGTVGNDIVAGTDNVESIIGGAGNDSLSGGAGNDFLVGGAGVDRMNGGDGSDHFVFSAIGDSGITSATYDQLDGFVSGIDKIDLSAMDANSSLAGQQHFTFVAGAFTGAGQVHFIDSGANILVMLSNDADTAGESILRIAAIESMTANDLIL
jgi:Ca2+-binding RTX toxin-like protein